MITKNVRLYLGDGFPVRVPVSQYDTMWQFVFTIVNNSQPWQIPNGASAVLNGRKPDGNVFAFSGTIANNTVTVDADVQMSAVAGQTVCELSILADGKTVGTANFILDVEEAPKSADDVVSDTVLDGYGMMVTNAVGDYIERHPEVFGGDRFTQSAKNALLALLEKVAYIDENGQTYIDALESELFPPVSLLSITAVFNQGSATIYDTDTLDVLNQYLTVTANMSDGTTQTVTNYTLSGTLTEGTSTITAEYGGKTATFNVSVSATQYINVSYIQADGSSYINTNFTPDQNTSIVLDYMNTKASGEAFQVPLGVTEDTSTSANGCGFFLYIAGANAATFYAGNGGSVKAGATIGANSRNTFSMSASDCSIDGTSYGLPNSAPSEALTKSVGYPLYLFARNQGNSANTKAFATGRIYELSIYQNSTLVRHFVPVKRRNDGAYGLLETLSNEFYGNDGNGTITGSF